MGLPSELRKFWFEWDLRVVMLVILVLQVILTCCGHRRKSNNKLVVRILIWVAYSASDTLTTYGLGIISTKLSYIPRKALQQDGCHIQLELDEHSKLIAFWAPLSLFFLGGPDTITSYALEDNELWLRRLLESAVQIGATVYIIAMAWWSHLSGLSLLMLLAAWNKYAERVWALWLASADKLRDSMLTPPDTSLNYPNFMEEYVRKEEEGYIVKVHELIERPVVDVDTKYHYYMQEAYYLLQIFKRLFADLILSDDDRRRSRQLFKNKEWENAYYVIKKELESVYDMLYTKAPVLQSRWGLLRRFVGISLPTIVLVCFFKQQKPHYQRVDLGLTYASLVSIVAIEFYSFLWLLSSNWAFVQRAKQFHNFWSPYWDSTKAISSFIVRLSRGILNQSSWSDSVAQLKFLQFCCKRKTVPGQNILKCLNLLDKIEKYYFTSNQAVLDNVKVFIFKNLQNKAAEMSKEEELEATGQREQEAAENQRSSDSNSFRNYDYNFKRELEKLWKDADYLNSTGDLSWCWELEFDQCTLIWHIATECLYQYPYYNYHQDMATQLSRYMFYLLVRYPTMLPSGIGQIRLRDTLAEAEAFFKERGPDLLLQPNQDQEDSSCNWCKKFLLYVFCRAQLKKQENEEEDNIHKRCSKYCSKWTLGCHQVQ